MSQIAHIINFKKNKKVQLWDIADYDYKMASGVKKNLVLKVLQPTMLIKLLRINQMEL